jgi:hypothetical protein
MGSGGTERKTKKSYSTCKGETGPSMSRWLLAYPGAGPHLHSGPAVCTSPHVCHLIDVKTDLLSQAHLCLPWCLLQP